jgi:Mn-dependent DtxR family transcriptional regulator
MQFPQIQNEILDSAHSQGQVDPGTFARLMRYESDDVQAAISDLVNRGLMAAAEGGKFQLTGQGEAAHRAQEEAHRADVISRTGTWQPR